MELLPLSSAAVDFPALVAGSFDQNATHGGGGGREEVSATIPAARLAIADQAQVCLMDESSGFERLAGLLAASFCAANLRSSS